ncbi:MAG: hypothetical protein ACKPFF_14210 [Planktothrix sp.]
MVDALEHKIKTNTDKITELENEVSDLGNDSAYLECILSGLTKRLNNSEDTIEWNLERKSYKLVIEALEQKIERDNERLIELESQVSNSTNDYVRLLSNLKEESNKEQ